MAVVSHAANTQQHTLSRPNEGPLFSFIHRTRLLCHPPPPPSSVPATLLLSHLPIASSPPPLNLRVSVTTIQINLYCLIHLHGHFICQPQAYTYSSIYCHLVLASPTPTSTMSPNYCFTHKTHPSILSPSSGLTLTSIHTVTQLTASPAHPFTHLVKNFSSLPYISTRCSPGWSALPATGMTVVLLVGSLKVRSVSRIKLPESLIPTVGSVAMISTWGRHKEGRVVRNFQVLCCYL